LPIPEIVKQGYRNALDEIDRLRKQLKACREAVEDYQKSVAEKDTDLAKLVDEIDRLREENTLLHRERGLAWGLAHIDEKERDSQIEQRTEEKCIKAGWKWIIKRIPPKYIPNDDERSFKQAISEAEVNIDKKSSV
jgi:hypothetical protein